MLSGRVATENDLRWLSFTQRHGQLSFPCLTHCGDATWRTWRGSPSERVIGPCGYPSDVWPFSGSGDFCQDRAPGPSEPAVATRTRLREPPERRLQTGMPAP